MKRIFFSTLLSLAIPAWAHQPADGLIHASFGPYFFQTHSLNHEFHSPIYGGFGMLAEADLDDNGGLELSVFHMKKLFALERQDMIVVERVRQLYVSLGYRHWFNKDFSLAAAFSSSYLMGNADTIRNDFGATNPPNTSARDTVDYGIDLSLQYETFRMDGFAVIFDGRYSYSLTPKPGEDANHYALLVAFKYFIQGRQPGDDEE